MSPCAPPVPPEPSRNASGRMVFCSKFQKEAQELVAKHMEEFFFGEAAALPPGYVPQQTK